MKKIIQVHVFRGESQFVAECLDLPVVTQGKTLDTGAESEGSDRSSVGR